MSRLKNRQSQIPNGLTFYQPETRWSPARMSSFETIVQGLIAHRNANPYLRDKNGWPTEYNAVCDEVDAFNARICEMNGWQSYIIGGPVSSPPPANPHFPPPSRGAPLVAGGTNLIVWLASGAEAVSRELATKRAALCAADCPQNGKGDWTRYFTKPVSEAIRHALNLHSNWHLETPHDAKLNVCEACDCPLKLKVNMPLERVLKGLTPDQRAKLDPRCWILKNDQI